MLTPTSTGGGKTMDAFYAVVAIGLFATYAGILICAAKSSP